MRESRGKFVLSTVKDFTLPKMHGITEIFGKGAINSGKKNAPYTTELYCSSSTGRRDIITYPASYLPLSSLKGVLSMKWFHNGPVGRGIAVILEVGIHLVFALGMFYLGQFLGTLILRDIPYGPEILGAALAVVMFLGAMYAFVYHEYTRKDVRAYEGSSGDGTFEKAADELIKIVAGMEIASLLYRCYNTFPNWFGAIITLALGLLLLRFAFVLGKVIHAVTNRPVSEEFRRVKDELDRDIVKSGLDYRGQMDYDQKRRFRNGDVRVIDEIRRGHDKGREIADRDRAEIDQAEDAVRKMLSFPGASADEPDF